MKNEKPIHIFMCPPYPEYKEPPADHSKSELFECPKCKGQMWLSQKKKGALLFASVMNNDIILACYPCIKKHAEVSAEDFKYSRRVDL